MKLELIEWVDSMGAGSNWSGIEDVEPPEPLVCLSAGWVVSESEHVVVVVPHRTVQHDVAHLQGCGDMTIPKVAIRSRLDIAKLLKDSGEAMAQVRKAATEIVASQKSLHDTAVEVLEENVRLRAFVEPYLAAQAYMRSRL